MLSVIRSLRKSLGRFLIVASAVALAACVPSGPISQGGNSAASSKGPVRVALLVPGGSGNASDQVLADSLVNSARLAAADLAGAAVDLRVYQTGGQPAQAQAVALQAANEGAQIILGPVFAQEANAAGVAMASRGLNVLAFSNNTDIAGGNVFVLGPTFENTARRLGSYAARNGNGRIMIVHDQNTAGEVGRNAIQRGVAAGGGTVVGVASYEFSQTGVSAAAPNIVASAQANGATGLFLTADTAGALPLLSQLLVENGLDRNTTRMIGLTRWDVPAQTLSLPGVQGGLFAMPDPNLYNQFKSRYETAYGHSPHPIAGLAYDGIAAIGALARQGSDLSTASLTQNAGFVGVTGIFRLRSNGTNERGLAVAEIRNNQVLVIEPAPRAFSNAGF